MFDNVFKDKRVLITGHTGFKGSWLALWLEKLGATVAGYSSYIPSVPSHFEVLYKNDRDIIDYRKDVRDIESLSKVIEEFKPQVVFHLAAKPIVKECYQNPKEAFDTNLGGTVNVMEAIRGSKDVQAFVLVTSDKCYYNVEWEFGYRETDRLGGKDPYSASKGCAELAFTSYYHSYFLDSHTKIASGRAGNVIGGGDWADYRIVPDCMKAWSEGQPLKIRNPHSTRPWQHVLEPLSGYLNLAQKLLQDSKTIHGESFNFGPESTVISSVSELIDEMGKIWEGGSWELEGQTAVTEKEANFLKLTCDKSLNRLNWYPVLSFEQTVNMTVKWYKEYYSKVENMATYTSNQIDLYQNIAKERNVSWAQN